MKNTIDYSPKLKITNVDQLPRGLGCPLLLVIESPCAGEYIAKRWLRKMPRTIQRYEHIIRF